jgi:hypothetical protein
MPHQAPKQGESRMKKVTAAVHGCSHLTLVSEIARACTANERQQRVA